jgi:hypothetical protein
MVVGAFNGATVAVGLLSLAFVSGVFVGTAVAFAFNVGAGVAPPLLTVPGFVVAAITVAFGDGEDAAFTGGTGEARLLPAFVFVGTGVTLAPLAPGFNDAAGAIVAPFFVVAAGEGDALTFLPAGTGVAVTLPVFLSFCAVAGFTFGVGVATVPAPFSFTAASFTCSDIVSASLPASFAERAVSSAAREPGVSRPPILYCCTAVSGSPLDAAAAAAAAEAATPP